MRKLIVVEFLAFDRVMQAPGGEEEDPRRLDLSSDQPSDAAKYAKAWAAFSRKGLSA